MRTVAYSEVLSGVTDAMGWEVGTHGEDNEGQANLDTPEWHSAKRAISKSYRTIHESADWPDLIRTELRRWHPEYSDTDAVEALEFRFFPPTGAYYQALRDTTGNAPATESSAGEWETNLAFWSDASRALSGDPYDATVQYEVGTRVYYASDDTIYQLHTAAVAGTGPTDDTAWGAISELDPRAPWAPEGFLAMGRIFAVNQLDPRKYRQPWPVPWTQTVEGVQIRNPRLVQVWITFLIRPFQFKGDIYNDTVTYTPDTEYGFGVPTVPGVGATGIEFSTIQAMLESDTTLWSTARCQNFEVVGDHIKTGWFKTSEALTPNGTNVLETDDGAIVYRDYIDYPQE